MPTVDGRYKVPHFDATAEADAIFREYEVPTTFLRTTLFYEGFAGATGPSRGDDGALVLTLPMAYQKLSSIAVGDIGATALGIFRRGAEFIGRTVSIAGDHLTGEQYASALSDALGEPVSYRPMGWDDFVPRASPSRSRWETRFSTTRRTRSVSSTIGTWPRGVSSIRDCSRSATGLPCTAGTFKFRDCQI